MKLNTKKFMRNIIICIIAWLVVSFILNYAPGFKRDKYAEVPNLIINDENLTEELIHNIYINENGEAYLSKEDIAKFFDKNVYYDEEYKSIITTSNTKTAIISIEDSKITINGVAKNLDLKILKMDEVIYIPIRELGLVYNIHISHIEDHNGKFKLVIERLNEGLIKAQVEEAAKVKFKPRLLSKNVGTIEKGEEVSCYYTTSKGWRLIRKKDGTLGYVKANVLGNEYIVRQDLNDTIETKEIVLNLKDGSDFTIYNDKQEGTKITIKTLFSFGENGVIGINQENFETGNEAIWATISNKGLEKQTNKMMKNYKTRTQLIDTIVGFVSQYRLRGININFTKIENQEDFNRFIIEITPRLRELGITTNVILNNSFKQENLVGIVDFLITEKGE